MQAHKEYKEHYPSPQDYLQAQKVFNTALLDALRTGTQGKYKQARKKLTTLLNDIPSGVDIGGLSDAIYEIIEISNRSKKSKNEDEEPMPDVDLVEEFDRLYKRTITLLQRAH